MSKLSGKPNASHAGVKFMRYPLIQNSLFAKTKEDVVATLPVTFPVDVVKKTNMFGIDFDLKSLISKENVSFTLCITLVRGADGFHTPKLHQLKMKSSDTWSVKKTKPLKILERVLVGPEPGMMSFYFSGGKIHSWKCEEGDTLRNAFVWWMIETCRYFLKTVPAFNIDAEVYSSITSLWTGLLQSGQVDMRERGCEILPPPNALGYVHKTMLQLVQKNRAVELEQAKDITQDSIQLPSITDTEAKDIEYFLKQTGLDIQNVDKLEKHLQNRLAEIENESICLMFAAQGFELGRGMLAGMDKALNDLEEITSWVTFHDSELNLMRSGIEQIEKRNEKLGIVDRNYDKLYKTLSELINEIKLDYKVVALIKNPDFENSLNETLDACKTLDSVLKKEMQGSMQGMKAVIDEKNKHEQLRIAFAEKATVLLSQQIVASGRVAVESVTEANVLSLTAHQKNHSVLRRLVKLAQYLNSADPTVHVRLGEDYVAAFKKVFEADFRQYFKTVNKIMVVESRDARISAHADLVVDGSANIGKDISKLAQSFVKDAPAGSMTRVFAQTLQRVAALCMEEQRFLVDFFAVKEEAADEKKAKRVSIQSGADNDDMDEEDEEEESVDRGGSFHVAVPSTSSSSSSSSSAAAGALTRKVSVEKKEPAAAATGGAAASSASSSATPAPTVRGRAGSADAAGGDKKSVIKNMSSIKKMLQQLIMGLEEELKQLIALGDKADHFNSLEMLIACERLISTMANEEPCEYLVAVTSNVQALLMQLWGAFIDAEVININTSVMSGKQAGVLPTLLKFPCFLEHCESVIVGMRSQTADMTYSKCGVALLNWIERMSKQDEKYTDVVMMENMHYLFSVFNFREPRLGALQSLTERAKKGYLDSRKRYVQWHLDYELAPLTKFWKRLAEELKNTSPEEIQLSPDLSKQELREVVKSFLNVKSMEKRCKLMLERLRKHLPKNKTLVAEVWAEIRMQFLSQFIWFDRIMRTCYQNESVGLSPSEITGTFDTLLPPTEGVEDDDADVVDQLEDAQSADSGRGMKSLQFSMNRNSTKMPGLDTNYYKGDGDNDDDDDDDAPEIGGAAPVLTKQKPGIQKKPSALAKKKAAKKAKATADTDEDSSELGSFSSSDENGSGSETEAEKKKKKAVKKK